MANTRQDTNKKDIDKLRKSINGKGSNNSTTAKTKTKTVETPAVETPAVETSAVETPAVETPAVETSAVETIAVETPAVETPAVETPAVETPADAPKVSIFSKIYQKTEEDIKRVTTPVESIAQDLKNSATAISEPEAEAEAKAKKEASKVKAGIVVELCDVVFMIICILITWDFSEENQKTFTLNNDRKNAIKHNLQKLYELDTKAPNPKRDIWFLIIGSYTPMLIVAVFMMFRRFKNKADEKKMQANFNQIQASEKAKMDALLSELEAERFKSKTLSEKLDATDVKFETVKDTTIKKDRELLNRVTPKATKIEVPLNFKKSKNKKGSGRGVKAGTKRGSYKK
jgi:hypothetical protein